MDDPDVRLLPARTALDVARQLSRLLTGDRTPAIVHAHMSAAEAAAALTAWGRRHTIVTTRHFPATRGSGHLSHLWAPAIARRIDAQIAVSEYVARHVDGDAIVVHPGVADQHDGPSALDRQRMVLLVQRLEPEKETAVGLRAFARSGLAEEGWTLVIAGVGSQRPDLEALADELGISGMTRFLGRRHDIEHLMARAGIFLAPTAVEAMGLATLEAMASGLPVVASAAGGHLESVGPTPDSALFAPGDVEAAATHLTSLARDPELRDRYGRALRDRQRTAFALSTQAAATDEVYDHARRGRRPSHGARRDLVVISLESWDLVWRRNQHLLHGLLSTDPELRILFVEPGQDPLHAARLGALPSPGRGLRRGPHLTGIDPDALWLLEPTKLLPRRIDPRQDERWALAVRRAADRLGMSNPTLWVNDPRGALVMRATGWPTIYDITDDWLLADRDPAALRRLADQEDALFDRAREVVVCSPSLVVSKSSKGPVTLIPNAVDVDAVNHPAPRPIDLPCGPVAVYLGTLHSDRLDVALCEQTARTLGQQGHVVLVGPDALKSDERARLEAAGVLLLGAKDHRSVPAYLQHADVLVVPHVVDDFTDSLDPIKLYEYRAVGRPVVSTPVAGFREAAGPRLVIAGGEDFVAAVAAALPADDHFPVGVDEQIPTWDDRVDEMRAVLQRVSGDGAGTQVDVPLAIRTRFGHAAVQHIANRHGLDVLHIKGDALDPSITYPGRDTTDADVLVRPAHVDQLIDACTAAGYRLEGRFATSSPFEHSRTLWHRLWGYLDVHRLYPGIGLDPAEAFEQMWAERRSANIGGLACPVPSIPAQAAMLVMHAARNPIGGQPTADVEHVWHRADTGVRAQIDNWVSRMDARVAFTVGIGELDSLPPSAERDLWQAVTAGGRVNEWRARIAAAPNLRTRVVLTLRAPLVNTDHLAKQLGHRPSRPEVMREFIRRARRAFIELSRSRGRR